MAISLIIGPVCYDVQNVFTLTCFKFQRLQKIKLNVLLNLAYLIVYCGVTNTLMNVLSRSGMKP